ncbi:MAG: flagellin lysine-N-methylase [Lachnospiraceae bacterium]|nr:flagellin lysine-N-methylase [Lachnospiraceae bacterium]
MRYVYPDYYKKFECIGGECIDTCCAGWQVDVDDETAEMYKGLPLPIGDRLRDRLRGKKGGYYFKLAPKRRCPFLNDKNLCDIILSLGEGGLCVTCTEYPRFYADTPIYEQVDLTLSCPEAAEIFFSTNEPIKYITEDISDEDREDDGLFGEDPFGGEDAEMDEEAFEEQIEESDMDEEDEKRLLLVLSDRDHAISVMQDRSLDLIERWKEALHFEVTDSDDENILRNINTMEVVNPLWTEFFDSINENLPLVQEKINLMLSNRDEFLNCALERFSTYMLFRYLIDIFYHENPERTYKFIGRNLRILLLLLGESMIGETSVHISQKTMIERARIFSRQIEHSDTNVEILLK